MSEIDLARVNHPQASGPGLAGVSLQSGPWALRINPPSSRNRAFMLWLARGRIDEGDVESFMLMHLADVLAEAVVLDWSGVEDAEGNPVVFSVETARALFDANPAVALDVWTLSQDADAEDSAAEEDAIDRLGKPSRGRANGAATQAA